MPAVAAARRLVSVYNGGSMPTQPDHIFLTHPVELDGAEAEGGAASPNVDTSATIPVVVLWHAPQAGDLLVASSVGGRWVAERGGSQPDDDLRRRVREPPGLRGRHHGPLRLERRRDLHDRRERLLPAPGRRHLHRPGHVGGTLEYSATRTLSAGRDDHHRPGQQQRPGLLRRLRDPAGPDADRRRRVAHVRLRPELLLPPLDRRPLRPAPVLLRHDAEQHLHRGDRRARARCGSATR